MAFAKRYLSDNSEDNSDELEYKSKNNVDVLPRINITNFNAHIAIRNEDIGKLKRELGLNPDCVNSRDIFDYDNTPLHLAVRSNRIDMIKILLLCGANPNVKNMFKETPLMMSVSEEATHFLLDSGAIANSNSKL